MCQTKWKMFGKQFKWIFPHFIPLPFLSFSSWAKLSGCMQHTTYHTCGCMCTLIVIWNYWMHNSHLCHLAHTHTPAHMHFSALMCVQWMGSSKCKIVCARQSETNSKLLRKELFLRCLRTACICVGISWSVGMFDEHIMVHVTVFVCFSTFFRHFF